MNHTNTIYTLMKKKLNHTSKYLRYYSTYIVQKQNTVFDENRRVAREMHVQEKNCVSLGHSM